MQNNGKYSIFVAPSKFESVVNTKILAAEAISEGKALKELLKDKIIYEVDQEHGK